jgi:hypothetical protein
MSWHEAFGSPIGAFSGKLKPRLSPSSDPPRHNQPNRWPGAHHMTNVEFPSHLATSVGGLEAPLNFPNQ